MESPYLFSMRRSGRRGLRGKKTLRLHIVAREPRASFSAEEPPRPDAAIATLLVDLLSQSRTMDLIYGLAPRRLSADTRANSHFITPM